jgi:hypothetical protein
LKDGGHFFIEQVVGKTAEDVKQIINGMIQKNEKPNKFAND